MPARSLYFTAPGEVRVRERPVPAPASGEVRVRTVVSAVSPGTERLVYRGDAPTDLSADASIPSLQGDLDYPLQYGYAAVGTVSAVGDDVDDRWLDRTVFAFNPHESHFLADPDDLHVVPDDCSLETAALLPNVETALNFVMDGRPVVGERVVVFGQGVVGLLTTAILSTFPLERLVTVETVARRRELSRSFGADESFSPDGVRAEFSPSESSVDADVPTGADLVYELSGNPEALDDAIDVTGYDGRVVVGSWYGEKRSDLALGGRFHRSRIDIRSSQVSTIDPDLRGRWTAERRFEQAWQWLCRLDADRLVTDRFALGDAADAYRRLDTDRERTVQILFTYGQ
ncbi:2-desacetyl-2-hydroxyethyl bacteriochlorophyllide A dehydrogenase [Halogranum amylolyticum]|uniref:2-desacetyl-2-hydroxyethyl bacteriochlorophyllide A dehydrogenase n=1 Tax=Halogranum amylolyticum TaxID=660520 RepID=A0A1H8SGR1_9EURY|nr:zinc-binding alcohol dehydrogenase [Halogranum amylolyticum]SEO77544.1 2-desacetyl-2-hydroxyethyl bacteriochlorophyllide A dehydrogenase [Halogranum amylolyticum]